MYEVFDAFLKTETWHTDHPNDEERFYKALAKIVRNDGFNADNMGGYILQFTELGPEDGRRGHVDKLVSNAWAVRDFLKAADEM